jgi:hypothetical protein
VRFQLPQTATAVRQHREIPGLQRHYLSIVHFQCDRAINGEHQRGLIERCPHCHGFCYALDPNSGPIRFQDHEVQVHTGSAQQLALSGDSAVELYQLADLMQRLLHAVGKT